MKPIVIVIGDHACLEAEIEKLTHNNCQVYRFSNLTEVNLATLFESLRTKGENGLLFSGIGLQVDSIRRRVLVDSKASKLSELEMNLLCFLIERSDRVLSRDQILNEVWGLQTYVVDRVVDSHVRSIRRKLGRYRDYIVTVYGGGYKFNPEAYRDNFKDETLPEAA